jgi:hypothetical protein
LFLKLLNWSLGLNLFQDPASQRQLQELDLLENFLARQPNTAKVTSEQLLASYLDCSGLINSQCLEYLACLYTNPAKDQDLKLEPEERNVISM